MASLILARVQLSNPTSTTTIPPPPPPYLPFRDSAFLTKYRRRWILTVQSKIREIFMPTLNSTMTEGKIISWIKSQEDKLKKGESVVVIESDKAEMDVETFYSRILAAIVVPEGKSASIGAVIVILAQNEEELDEAKSKAASISTVSSLPPLLHPLPHGQLRSHH